MDEFTKSVVGSINEGISKLIDDESAKRRALWMEIFDHHPDFAGLILSLLDAYGDEVYDNLMVLHKDGKVTMGWYTPMKEDNNAETQ